MKSRNQKKASTVLCVAGGVTTITGLIVAMSGFSNGWSSNNSQNAESKMNTGNALIISGSVMFCAGITLIFLSRSNEKKGKLLLGTTHVKTPYRIYSKEIPQYHWS